MGTIYMKCQSLFSGKKKKKENIIHLSFDEILPSMLSVTTIVIPGYLREQHFVGCFVSLLSVLSGNDSLSEGRLLTKIFRLPSERGLF